MPGSSGMSIDHRFSSMANMRARSPCATQSWNGLYSRCFNSSMSHAAAASKSAQASTPETRWPRLDLPGCSSRRDRLVMAAMSPARLTPIQVPPSSSSRGAQNGVAANHGRGAEKGRA